MDHMGIWFENFALPVVINECLMQSYNGTIRLFPNWPVEKDAEFFNLRAAGGFLVSASVNKGNVTRLEIISEAGAPLKMELPWEKCTLINEAGEKQITTNELNISTKKGARMILMPR